MMYKEILDEKRCEILEKIINNVSLDNYYLIGGTALSLQLGLRNSYDFDFCVPNKFDNEILLEELKTIGNVEVKQNSVGTCDVIIDGIQVSFFYFPNQLINELVTFQEFPKLKIASVLDIAIMKVVAISGRGTKKDFFDLYNILNKKLITIEDLLNGLKTKYGNDLNYLTLIMGFSYFEDAENEVLPQVYVEYNWEEIKKFFIDFQEECEKIIMQQ